MRLSFEISGEVSGKTLRVRLGSTTVTDEHSLPWDAARTTALAEQIVDVLRRGNRARSLAESALSELRFLGEELYRALIPPGLEEALRRGQGPLLLDLDEALVPVPFELVFDGAQYLCRRYALGRMVRSRVPRRGQERQTLNMPPRALVLAADPRGDLPEVHAESDAIVEVLDREKVRARVLTASDRETLRRELKDYDLVHFAGHADFLPADPGQSGWHLSSGKLTAADIAELAGGRPMPLVVFSNACESGRTDGWSSEDAARRAYGLAGAFLYAGVRHYVGTQWEVIDGHSATFATAFYANLASGQSIGAAVQHARTSVVQAGGECALAWASYVLYGDPEDRPLKRATEGKLAMPSPKLLAARASAPWKRPTPNTMKRVGAELAALHKAAVPKVVAHAPRSSMRPLLLGAAAGLVVTATVAGIIWSRGDAPKLVRLPIAAHTDAAARVEACLDGALMAGGAPLVAQSQLAALAKSTDVAATDDARAVSLAQALGARWVLWGTLATDARANLRLVDVKSGALLRGFSLPLDDLAAHCADEAQRLTATLR
ncbi:MAG: CHAT domain-containing protein [Polyangia bacterium]